MKIYLTIQIVYGIITYDQNTLNQFTYQYSGGNSCHSPQQRIQKFYFSDTFARPTKKFFFKLIYLTWLVQKSIQRSDQDSYNILQHQGMLLINRLWYYCIDCVEESISNRIQIGNVCQCKTGYSEYEVKEQICGKCHAKCLTCFQPADGSENQYCLTCIPGQNRVVSDTFKCDCEVNYSDFGGILEVCAVCHYTCGNCIGVEATNCSQCSETSNRELTPLGECLCKQSYFDDNTENITCQKCHHSCLICASSTEKDTCLECPSSRTAQSSGSFFECFCTDSNTFDDGFSLQCQQCDQSCKTCFGPLSSNCLTCDTNYRQLELSFCVCPINYYDIGQLECAECHYSCHRCFDNNAESCIMCSFDLNLRVLKGNICKCVDGYYEEVGIAQCQKCAYKCETCNIQPDKCLSCPLNSIRKLDPIKGCYCPEEYFDKENEITCLSKININQRMSFQMQNLLIINKIF
ncbi:unnamed protein product [Paramecium primaurelia]|uniref:Insulin-like growth factor binding protein, N-terminal n=1 Tax=Paramecium primaurelia TaxID=5886 RepID=A0A8S1QPR4_PARPR|nr:unnamed protein product [Paramecium primaurelia]